MIDSFAARRNPKASLVHTSKFATSMLLTCGKLLSQNVATGLEDDSHITSSYGLIFELCACNIPKMLSLTRQNQRYELGWSFCLDNHNIYLCQVLCKDIYIHT